MQLLDNTVLSNFALIGQINLIENVLGRKVATTTQVISEFNDGVSLGRLPHTDLDWLEVLELNNEEEPLFQELLNRLNKGEAACLAVASNRNFRFLTDDRDARKLAAQMQIPVSGSIGILLRLIKLNIITLPEGNNLLQQMVRHGYHSPVVNLTDL